VGLAEELELAAAAAASYGAVSAVLAAEPAPDRRVYLVALGDEDSLTWLALDGTFGPITDRERVREAASIVVLCELAGELAGGGGLEELRAQLVQVRVTEQPEGIEAVEEAALDLERAIGAPPVLATPAYLDAVGTATRHLESTLGEHGSPFANALASSSGTVEAFVSEVAARHAVPLR
jgi:hypothetical protein